MPHRPRLSRKPISHGLLRAPPQGLKRQRQTGYPQLEEERLPLCGAASGTGQPLTRASCPPPYPRLPEYSLSSSPALRSPTSGHTCGVGGRCLSPSSYMPCPSQPGGPPSGHPHTSLVHLGCPWTSGDGPGWPFLPTCLPSLIDGEQDESRDCRLISVQPFHVPSTGLASSCMWHPLAECPCPQALSSY